MSLAAQCLKHASAQPISHCAACFCLFARDFGLHTNLTLKLRMVKASWKPEEGLKMHRAVLGFRDIFNSSVAEDRVQVASGICSYTGPSWPERGSSVLHIAVSLPSSSSLLAKAASKQMFRAAHWLFNSSQPQVSGFQVKSCSYGESGASESDSREATEEEHPRRWPKDRSIVIYDGLFVMELNVATLLEDLELIRHLSLMNNARKFRNVLPDYGKCSPGEV